MAGHLATRPLQGWRLHSRRRWHAIARIGDEITLGGGEIPANEFEFLQGKLATDVPDGCRGSDYWVTNGPASAG
jgi:hypothetical protein